MVIKTTNGSRPHGFFYRYRRDEIMVFQHNKLFVSNLYVVFLLLVKNDVDPLEPDLGKWPPLRKKINFISTTEQNLLFILSCVATMH